MEKMDGMEYESGDEMDDRNTSPVHTRLKHQQASPP